MLEANSQNFDGKSAVISGSGNVAQYAAEKCIQMGAKVLTMSDSKGFIHDPAGIDRTKLDWIMDLKNKRRGRIQEYVNQFPEATFHEGQRPWGIACHAAFPCATQNELNEEEA